MRQTTVLVLLVLFSSSTFAQKDIYFLIGQSNMAGRATMETMDQQTFEHVFLFNAENNWEIAENPLNKYSTVRKDISLQRLGLGYAFSKKLTETYPDMQIGLVVNARGGSSISQWQKGETLYNEALSRIQVALAENSGNNLKAIIWHQGEANANSSTTYLGLFSQMVTDFRSDLNRANLPIIVGGIGEWNTDYDAMNQVIPTIPENVDNAYYVSSSGLTNIDFAHFDSASQRILGERYANKMIEILSQQEYTPEPLFDASDKFGGGLNPDEVIIYKTILPDTDLVLNVFTPDGYNESQDFPCAIFIHGGAWTGGSPSYFYTMAKYLADRGMLAISLKYRLGQGVDICVEDAKSAVRYVRENAAELKIDPNKIAVLGGSAGGQMAAATAVVTSFDSPEDNLSISPIPNALILFNPVLDNGPSGYGYSSVSGYWNDISPYHNIKPNMPPILILSGEKDTLIPPSTLKSYQNLVIDAGNACELIIYTNETHGFFNHWNSMTNFFDTLQKSADFLVQKEFIIDSDLTTQKWFYGY